MRLLSHFFLLFLVPAAARSQRDTTGPVSKPPVLSITGAADVFYRYDLARSASNNLTSFTGSHNQFNLGMAEVQLEHKTSRVDMVADLAVGLREQIYAHADSGIAQAIKQLYISYSPTNWVKFTAGTWGTHLCIESPAAASNRNYSMSYCFSNDPYSHTGVKAEFSLGKSGFMIGVSNPNDYRTIPAYGHPNKDLIAQYTYISGDDFKLYLNYVGGRDIFDNRAHQYDLVLSAKTGKLFSLGFNGTVNRSSLATEKYTTSYFWWGTALYLNLDPKPWLGLTLRTEYFDDRQGVTLPAPASVMAATLSANLKVDGLTFIPEFRVDRADASIFHHADGSAENISANFLLAAVYSF